MENHTYIRELLRKFVAEECTEEEKRILIDYFRKNPDAPDDIMLSFDEIKDLLPKEALGDEAMERIYASIQAKMNAPKNRRKPRKYYWAAAAIVVLLLATGMMLKFLSGDSGNENFDLHGSEITLVNERGEVEIIDPTQVKMIATAAGMAEQDRATLIFKADGNNDKLVYNTLRVPYGKTFRIVLSDGTSVDLNAGTSLTFPVSFARGGTHREVTVKGEAFFNVRKNENQPFIVHTGEMDVNVLGTEFNVSNYPENKTSDVVLIKGAVSISENGEQMSSFGPVTLTPGEKGTFHRESGRVKTEKVTTGIYTAWLNGELVFRNTSFANILKMLERKYNVEIDNRTMKLSGEEFNTSFKEETVEQILEYFKITYGIDYTRSGNKIIIN